MLYRMRERLWRHWLFYFWIIFANLISANRGRDSASLLINDDFKDQKCFLPVSWQGLWYGIMDKTETPVKLQISNSSIDIRGECKHRLDDQYLFMDLMDSGEHRCYRYMFLYEKHHNILQFKETGCLRTPGLYNEALKHLSGDSTLVTIFRADSISEPCPVQGPFVFNYSSESGFCGGNSHESKGDACASSSKVRFNFESCPHLPRSDKWRDDLLCVASWHDSKSAYFAAKIVNHHYLDEMNEFRCFMHERLSHSSGIISRSADPSCRAMESIKIWYTNMNQVETSCKFPSWFIRNEISHRKRIWHMVASSSTDEEHKHSIDVHRHDWVVRNAIHENVSTTRCISEMGHNDDGYDEFIVYKTKGCTSYYYCLRLFRRTDSIVQLLESGPTPTLNEQTACKDTSFRFTDYQTVYEQSSVPVQCPIRGRFYDKQCRFAKSVDLSSFMDEDTEADYEEKSYDGDSKGILGESYAEFGCANRTQMSLNIQCDYGAFKKSIQRVYTCVGHWTDGDLTYLVVKGDETRGGVRRCFIYSKDKGDGAITITNFRHCTRSVTVNSRSTWFDGTKTDSCQPLVRQEATAPPPTKILIGSSSETEPEKGDKEGQYAHAANSTESKRSRLFVGFGAFFLFLYIWSTRFQ